jgi:hypothetical protein
MIGGNANEPVQQSILPGLLQMLRAAQSNGGPIPRGLLGNRGLVASSLPSEQPPQSDDATPPLQYPVGADGMPMQPALVKRGGFGFPALDGALTGYGAMNATPPRPQSGGSLASVMNGLGPAPNTQTAPQQLPTQTPPPMGAEQGGLPQLPGNVPALARPNAAPAFDYDAAMAAMLPKKPKGKGIFGSGVHWYDALGLVGDALAAAGGGQGGYGNTMLARRMEDDKRRFEAVRALTEWRHADAARQQQADLDASQPFTLGRSRYRLDPTTGQVATLQTAPMDFETYAASQGFKPGTPEYNQAAQDYILRGNGPTAVGLDASLDDHRTGNRVRLEGVRAGNRSALEGQRQAGRASLRSMPTYRDLHPSAGGGRGGSIPTVSTPQEAMALPPGTKFRTPDGRVKIR